MTDSFSELRRDFGLFAVRLGRHWRNVVDAELGKFGLTGATWRPLYYLGRSEGVRPKDLAIALDVERPSAVQLVDRLVAQGLVERRDDPDDRRCKLLYLTPAGREIYRRTIDVSVAVGEQLTAGLSDSQLRYCQEIFAHIQANMIDEDQA